MASRKNIVFGTDVTIPFAPISLFVYNRPEHTKKTLSSLMANLEFSKSQVYVYCDGPKHNKDIQSVAAVREIIRALSLPNIVMIKQEENLGLANSIIGGVTDLCKKYGRVIVLEDDLEVSSLFLNYMNKALNHYKNEKRVMQISGYMFPVKLNADADAIFLPLTTSWGWATWARAWNYFEHDAANLLKKIEKMDAIYKFNLKDSIDYKKMLQKQIDGRIDSWAIRWYASMFIEGGLALFPKSSFIKNIGHDGSGTHGAPKNIYDVDVSNTQVLKFPIEIRESESGLEAMVQFYISNKEPIYKKIVRFINSVLRL